MKVSHFVTNCHFNKSTCKINQYWLKPVSLDETWKRDICGLFFFVCFFWHIQHFAIAFSNSSKSKTLKICKKNYHWGKKIRAVEILVPELLLRQVVLNLNISVISSSRFFLFGGNPDKQLFLPDYYCYLSIRASSFPLTTNNSLEAPRRERGL